MHVLTLLRYSGGKESTLGVWLDERRTFVCYTLEDEHRKVKVPGETCIPPGRYPLRKHYGPRFNGGMQEHFRDIYRGFTVEIADVPDFEDVLVHWGNRGKDTRGCVLVGDSAQQNVTADGFIGGSRSAYRRWYPPVAALLEAGESVYLDVIDYDDPMWE